jgi:cytochrome c-type biogenesis protein CcmF
MIDLIINIGYGALAVAFLSAIYSVVAAIYGEKTGKFKWVESARRSLVLSFPLLTISAVSIIYLLVTNRFEVAYVTNVTSISMPTYLRVTALWGGQPGSFVLWTWLMSIFVSGVMIRNWKREKDFLPWVIAVCGITLAFFLMLILFFENPFSRFWQLGNGEPFVRMFRPLEAIAFIPRDGNSLNPLLRHPGMIFHPPMQYLGMVSFMIPFSFAIAALITKRSDSEWIRLTRKWTLWAWLFLSIGLILGGRWAYDVLGWGGYWGWDPVEVAALLPWLTATPFLHSVMIEEKRGMFKHWNLLLVILTYTSMIYGTFLVRSGVLSSVHAFAQSPIGPLFFAFIVFTLGGSLWLLINRWQDFSTPTNISSEFSREYFFLLNNIAFLSIWFICFWGVNFPIITEAVGFLGDWFPSLDHIFTGQKVTVGPPYYEKATGPVWWVLLVLMGIAPMTAWGARTWKTLGKNLRFPFIASLPVLAILPILGVTQRAGIGVFWASTLVTFVIFYEFYRGAMARKKKDGGFFKALFHLIGRNRRRYGGYIIHFGVVLMAIGIIGIEVFQTETQGSMGVGDSITLGKFELTYDDLKQWNTEDNRNVTRAEVGLYKNGVKVDVLNPRIDYYYENQQQMTIPGVYSSIEGDFYVLLAAWNPTSTRGATFKAYHNPLVNWLWWGTIIFVAGTMVASWPEDESKPKSVLKNKKSEVGSDK